MHSKRWISLLLTSLLLASCGGGATSSEPILATSEPAPETSEPAPESSQPLSSSKEIEDKENYAAFLNLTPAELQQRLFGDYDALLRAAEGIVDPKKAQERYEAFAKAECNLLFESALVYPYYNGNSYTPTVSRVLPYRKANVSTTTSKLKNLIVVTEPINQEQAAVLKADYEAKKKGPFVREEGEDGFISLEDLAPNPIAEGGKIDVAGVEFALADTYHHRLKRFPLSFDYLRSGSPMTTDLTANLIDGLVEFDRFNNPVGALSTAYKVEENPDGTETWTFRLRDDGKWFDSKGQEQGDVSAEDFVDAARFILNPKNGSNLYYGLVGLLANAEAYYSGAITDFSKVGVKANEDGTLSYTLNKPTPYFLTMLAGSAFLPVKGSFLMEKGADFGKTPSDLLVNGAYRVSAFESEKELSLTKNEGYWDEDHVYAEKVDYRFAKTGEPISALREAFESGEVDSFEVQSRDKDGWAAYVAGNEMTGNAKAPANPLCFSKLDYGTSTYFAFWNFNRRHFLGEEAKTPAEKRATAYALCNQEFRQAFVYGFNVHAYLGEMLAYPDDALTRGLTNRGLLSYQGKDYADYVDEAFRQHWGEEGDSLTGLLQGGDPLFDMEEAKAKLLVAKTQLIASGELEESDFPIRIDVEAEEGDVAITAALSLLSEWAGDIVSIHFNWKDSNSWTGLTYDYDFSLWGGWGPDFLDPGAFLGAFALDGELAEYFGF